MKASNKRVYYTVKYLLIGGRGLFGNRVRLMLR
jgi:hypothetical protein